MSALSSWARCNLARRVLVMALALLWDVTLGDPPNRYHPVAWCGRAIAAARRLAPTQGRMSPLLFGLGVTFLGGAALTALGAGASRALARLPRWAALPVEALLLKQTLALRGLVLAAREVARPLAAGDLPRAQTALAWHLVSRDTTALDTPRVAAAAVESVAENASDGVIAPLVAYAIGGLPAAWVYRWVNTLDAMWGYRDAQREWLGKAPARLDDGLNWLPARLTAWLLIGAAPSGARGRAWAVWRRDRALTASPNAGQPMSAAAGALGVELEKPGAYRLGAGLPLPDAATIEQSAGLLGRAVTLFLFTAFLFMGAGCAWLAQVIPGCSARKVHTR